MRPLHLARWQWVHRWSSLICTAFLLVICLTGLPLVFSEEIETLTHPRHYAAMPADTPRASLDGLARQALSNNPGQIVTSIYADDDEPQVYVWMAPSFAAAKANPRIQHFMRFDARSGAILERSPAVPSTDVMTVMLRLHMDLFAGLLGELFMGAMGALFVAAVVSGVVLYGPFTRRLDFGAVRMQRARRTRWLDLHNLLGVVTLAWAAVVGLTGVMNELSTPLFGLWRATQVESMLAPWHGRPPLRAADLISPQAAFETASRALPGMVVTSVIYPGDANGSPFHYVLWAHGKSHLTAQLFTPVLVDARTGRLTAVVTMPWYLRALEVSRPLHFGNYGGLPLKILWALLDLVTILVLGSGLYLWWPRRRRQPAVSLPRTLIAEPAE